jgi:hypothetical protein
MCLTRIALAPGNTLTLVASVAFTFAGYAYRIHVEDAKLVAAFGEPYKNYCRDMQRFSHHSGKRIGLSCMSAEQSRGDKLIANALDF